MLTKEKEVKSGFKLVILAVLCTLLWGSAFPSVKVGYELFHIGATDTGAQILFAGYRFTLAGIMTFVVACGSERKLVFPKPKVRIPIVVLGLLQTTLQYIFFYVGLSHTTGVKGSILTAANVFFAILLAHIFVKGERLTIRKLVGCVLGFLGVAIVNFSTNGFAGGFRWSGEGFLLIAGFCYALGSVYVKFFAYEENVITITAYQLFVGGVILIVTGFLMGGRVTTVTLGGGLLLGYMGLISCIAFTLWTCLLKDYQVGKVSIFGFATPIFGVLLSAVFLGEKAFTVKNLSGLLLVCGGILVVNIQKPVVSLVKNE